MFAAGLFSQEGCSPDQESHVTNRLTPVVAIPARDEAALLPRLIAALGQQTVLERLERPLDVIIVLNNTTDGSLAAAETAAKLLVGVRIKTETVVFSPDRAHVGSARRHAMDLAVSMEPAGVILTTDADAVPSATWIEANLNAITAGADIVGGRIIGDPQEEAQLGLGFQRRAALHARYSELCDEMAALIDPLPHDPWPRHRDHTGGSLAVRASVYSQLGGVPRLPLREDIALVSNALAAGFRLVHPLDVVVTVSARTKGRAKGGMAECLTTWLREEDEGRQVLVENPADVEDRLRLRKAIRSLAEMPPQTTRRTLRDLGIDPDLAGTGTQWAAALIERFAPDDLDARATVPAIAAISALTERITALRGIADAA